ncbi:hypothetical protein CHS0354_032073 [Potamilus streckersoni]|uniref:Dendritic cell-specific transmembrane protein-like domain-containing protein n=1 Tax=Potamilus streckersoni TaxID=2493646 RepID=A0AAE0TL88_9BIVA|nr:hypothetical protein CHS0354_032073 [Potamilus streckersoni]
MESLERTGALFYQYKFLSNDRFDNIYVTYKVRDIDERRKALGREPILPLTWKEQGKYVYSNSLRLANKEKRKLIIGIVLFVVSAFNAGFYLACDYGLYTILELIRINFDIETKAVVPPHLKLHVDGKGPFADMYKAITAMFDPIAESNIQINTAPCLPHAFKPDFQIYIQIGIIYGVCLMLTVSEAYGLRLRHSIMACYYPKRERTRAIWLYNHIIKTRGNFLQNTRRELRRKYFGEKEEKQISLLSQMAARYRRYNEYFVNARRDETTRI